MKVLVVEDDQKIASFIVKGLKQANFSVDHVLDGAEGLSMTERLNYDAIVVDIMLPGMDGLTMIRTMRGRGIETPVLILSAKHTVDDKVRGFQTGGDDYLTKPFSFSELLVRIQALIRRTSQSRRENYLEIVDLKLDLMNREVTRAGKRIELQPREFSLLEYLMRNEGNVVSKTMILEHVWDYHFDPGTNVVDVLIHRLRSKVDREFESKLIRTVRGVGYVLKVS